MAYLKMPSWKYYSLTMLLYICCVIGAITVDNLGIVFEFVGAFGTSVVSFTMPGLMYLLILRNPNAFTELESGKVRLLNIIGSILMILLSVLNMILVLFKQVY